MNLDDILKMDLSPDKYCLLHNKIYELEQQCKKQKEVIDKANEYLDKVETLATLDGKIIFSINIMRNILQDRADTK